jgi:large subunit ribosomal protein L23
MKIKAVMTEKTMKLSTNHGLTFLVPSVMDKTQIRRMVENVYGVSVVSVKTVNSKPGTKKNTRGKVQRLKAVKKAIVFLKEGDKIDLFEEEKKQKKTKKRKAEK